MENWHIMAEVCSSDKLMNSKITTWADIWILNEKKQILHTRLEMVCEIEIIL